MQTVIVGIIKNNNKILIARRMPGTTMEGFWEFPGGTVQNGENFKECLRRELKEELDIEVSVKELFLETNHLYHHGYFRIIAYVAIPLLLSIKLSVHDQVEWVEVMQLKNYKIVPGDMAIVDKLIDHQGDNGVSP